MEAHPNSSITQAFIHCTTFEVWPKSRTQATCNGIPIFCLAYMPCRVSCFCRSLDQCELHLFMWVPRWSNGSCAPNTFSYDRRSMSHAMTIIKHPKSLGPFSIMQCKCKNRLHLTLIPSLLPSPFHSLFFSSGSCGFAHFSFMPQ